MSDDGVSRRDFLKRGAVVGGAALWMTPVVQTIAMSPALAATASPTRTCYAVRWTWPPGNTGTPTGCADISSGGGECFTSFTEDPVAGGCGLATAVRSGTGMAQQIDVTVPDGCSHVDSSVQRGQGSTCADPDVSRTGNVFSFTRQNGGNIGALELVFCCDN